jgi:PAS domain S-box-containing protein
MRLQVPRRVRMHGFVMLRLPSPTSLRFVLWAGFLAAIGSLIAITAWTAAREAEGRRIATERAIRSIAQAVDENLARSFDSSEQTLSDLADTIADRGGIVKIGEAALHELLKNRIGRAAHARSLFVYDASGRLFASSSRYPVPKLDATPDFVTTQLRGTGQQTLITPTLKGAVTGMLIIPMTRALWQHDGMLGGVIGVSLDPEYFEGFYRSMELSRHVIVVTDDNGSLMMRYPLPRDPALAQLPRFPGADAVTVPASLDGAEHICAFRQLEHRPLRVAVCSPTKSLGLLWWPSARDHLAVTALALLVAGALFALILRQLSRLERRDAERQINKFTLDHVSELVIWIDERGAFPFVNPAVLRALGFGAGEFAKLQIADIFPSYSPAGYVGFRERLRRERQITFDTAMRAADGHTIPVEASFNFIEYGGAEYNCVVLRDISARVESEQALRVGELRYRAMIDALAEGIIVRDRELIIECNPSAERIFGMSRADIVGKKTLSPPLRYVREDGSLFPGHEGPGFRSMETGVPQLGYVYGVVRADESVIWVSVSAQPLTLPGSGEPVGTVVSYTDFSGRKAAEDALRESEARLKTIFDTSPVAIVISAMEDGRLLYVNPVTSRINGYTPEEMIGRTAQDIRFWQSDDERNSRYREFFRDGRPFQFEKPFGRKDGSHGLALASVALIELEGQRCVLTIIQDITQLRAQEAALRESEARFAKFFDMSPIAVVVSGMEDGRATEINPAFEDVFGYSRSDVIGKTSIEIGLTVDHPGRERRMELLRKRGREGPDEVAVRDKAGRICHMLTSSFVLSLSGQQRVVSFFQDISERIRAEEDMRRFNEVLERRVAERTAELARANRELESFSYSVSHDLRSPLRGIDGFSALLMERYGEALGEQGQAYLDRVRRAANRMGNLIDDLLDLARVGRHQLKREPVDLTWQAQSIVDELRMFDAINPKEVTVAQGLSAVADASLMRIVLDNLLRNAWKFTARTAEPRIEVGAVGGADSVFYVRDNGAGFDMRFSARLFGPFQRLHDAREYEGTGIGLAIVRRIVQRHGGEVWAEGVVGNGATFYFTLPQGSP